MCETDSKTHRLCFFDIIGDYDEERYRPIIEEYDKKGIVTFLGSKENVHSFLKNYHALIQPSYHEGLSNVLLEAASCGRPVLASDIPGCKETFDEGISGLGFQPRNGDSLVKTVKRFLSLNFDEREAMGIFGRKKVEGKFNRQSVIDSYLKELYYIIN